MGYTKNEIISKCTAALGKISTFYKQNFVNYRGRTSDTNELFTEVIAEFCAITLTSSKTEFIVEITTAAGEHNSESGARGRLRIHNQSVQIQIYREIPAKNRKKHNSPKALCDVRQDFNAGLSEITV